MGNATALTITKAQLTYVATAASKAYGAALPTLTGTVSGFLGTDNQGNATTGTLTFTTTATASSSVAGGPYAMTGSGLSATNYSFGQAAGNATAFTVNPVALGITANSTSKAYGAALPTFTASYSGFVNGDTSASLTTAPTLSTTATSASSVAGGPYAITGSGAVDSNYTISYTAGTLTVNAGGPGDHGQQHSRRPTARQFRP